ncbi:phage tail sheath subtilisin-like domain-containing protein, partial [Carnobacterium sp.]|uniref:phage tail sheath subtilisin-like domain-containing protein n=1 Tax=Carnobacterium sp. TaxID=48221 RepID=UPI002FC771C3
PGAYINVKSKGNTMNASSNRGIVTLPVVLGFGPTKEVVEVDSLTNFIEEFGYDLASTELLTVHEALKQASKVIVYRVNTGEKAKADSGDLSVTALHGGKRGNDLSVIVKVNIDDSESFDVVTLLDTQVVAKQTAKTIEDLVGNHFVVFTGTGNLSELAGLKLIGGTDAPTTASDYSDYFKAIEVYDFNTMALPVSDAAIKNTAASFIKRLREEEGKKSQLVVANFSANSEAVINVKNGVKLSDGSLIPTEIATAWVAAATAQANVNESLTYYPYPNAVDVEPRYTNTEIIEALKAGSFLIKKKPGNPVLQKNKKKKE